MLFQLAGVVAIGYFVALTVYALIKCILVKGYAKKLWEGMF